MNNDRSYKDRKAVRSADCIAGASGARGDAVSDAPERIWAFHAPHIAEDESGATIVAHENVQHGGQCYVRADLYDAAVARAETAEAELEVLKNPPEIYCFRCGAPKSNHTYRHVFVGPPNN